MRTFVLTSWHPNARRILACDREENYERLVVHYESNVWSAQMLIHRSSALEVSSSRRQARVKGELEAEALPVLLLEKYRNLPQRPLGIPRKRLHHVQRRSRRHRARDCPLWPVYASPRSLTLL